MNNDENFNNFVKYISSLNPNEFTAVACIFGFLLSASINLSYPYYTYKDNFLQVSYRQK